MPAVARQYRQVIATYFDRPGFRRLLVPSFLAWGIWLTLSVYSNYHLHGRWYAILADATFTINALFLFLPIAVLFTYIAILMGHLREQLESPQTFLVPAYRKPHLVVGAIAFLIAPIVEVLVLMAADSLLGLNGRSNAVGLLAITLTAITPAAWLASSRSPWMALLMIPIILILLIWTPIGNFLSALAEGSVSYANLMAVQLILLDLAILGLLFIRLMIIKPDARRAREAGNVEPHSRVRPVAEIRHEPLLSTISRIWHRRRGVLDPWAPWAVASLLALLLVGFQAIHGGKADDLMRSLLLPAAVPGAIVSAVWLERLMNLQFESLYPATHRSFINELLGAAALSLAEMWISTMVAVLVPIAIWHHQIETHWPMLVTAIVASALMQVFVFGVILVAALRRSIILYANVLTVLAIIVPMAEAIGMHPSLSPRGLMVVSLTEMAVGLMLTLFGTTAWRSADLA